jgi:penicillin-binding protein 1C
VTNAGPPAERHGAAHTTRRGSWYAMRRVLRTGLRAGAATVAVAALVFAAWVLTPVPAERLAAGSTGLRIEDRNGLLLRSTRAEDGSRARWTPLAEMDPDLLLAFVAVEDKRFWSHHGVDVLAVGRAALANRRAGRVVSGASTIPMQLARLLRPRARGWRGKLGETAWGVRLSWHLTKGEVLEQYLNRVSLGQGAVGVSAAAGLYFGASVSELSAGEAAMLAGLAHAPSRVNPLNSPREARARRRVALGRMRRAGMISAAEERRANEEPVSSRAHGTPFLAPHFTTRLVQLDAREGVTARQGGPGRRDGPARVWRSTLDAALQEEVEGEVRHAVAALRGRAAQHAAAVVLENATGDVLAWVGSPDFWAEQHGQTDMVMSARQPGSALKPFLYALAFDRGVTAATVLADVPRSYATATGTYAPRNYDRRFRGPVRAREALASSYNMPAVELAGQVGVGALLETLRRAGFASLSRDAEHYGLGLALGNGDVTLIELANGFRALANGGVWAPWRWLASGRGAGAPDPGAPGVGWGAAAVGEVRDAAASRVVSSQAAALVLDVLADRSARVPGFGPHTPFDFPFPVAVKTGTSRHFTDNWAVATTRGFTVAVWVGNFSGQPMQGVSGVTGAGPLLNRVVTLTARRHAPGALRTPAEAGLTPVEVCRVSGLRATARCAGLTEWFVPGSEPTRADDWVRQSRVHLPAEYAEWMSLAGSGYELADEGVYAELAEEDRRRAEGDPGAAEDDMEGTRRAGDVPRGFRVVSPADGDVLRVPPGVPARYATVALRAVGEEGPVRWFVDGAPFTGARWPLVPGVHVIRAVGASGTASEVRIRVE